ncbi:MAG: transposase [Rhizobiaceae bacterium]|nr:MAG: transposase [Rhizobiaceae bacterium]
MREVFREAGPRLEDGEFRWPKVHDGMMRLTAAQLSALLEGLDWRRVHEARRPAFRFRRADPRRSESAWIPLSRAVGEYGLIRSWR